MNNEEQGHELGWDDVVEKESADFIVLEAGDYDFSVKYVEKARHTPNPMNTNKNKLPACNKAVIHIEIMDADGNTVTLKENLFLHSKTEGMICAFFTCLGMRKKGEKLQMNWNEVVTKTGRCTITKTPGKKDPTMFFNNVKKFIPADEGLSYETNEF